MPYEGPNQAIASVLCKLGIDPHERMDESDQDAEYTACRTEEISSYFELYSRDIVDPNERAVLGCFLLEGLNECIQVGNPHPLQDGILLALFGAGEIHATEFEYWMDTSDPDEENWWPITKVLLEYRERHRHLR